MTARADKHDKPFGSSETLTLEFKEAAASLPRNFFETVCAFMNRDGGLIVLGVADNGEVTGVNKDAVERLKTEIANLSNNPNKLEPPYLLFPHAEEVRDKWIIKVQVPASSQVHRTGGEVFLRSEDGDYRLKDPYQIAGLVNRKLSFYTEQRVLPWLGMKDLQPELFARARDLLRAQHQNHPWMKLANEKLLHIGGFIRQDPLSSQTGYTLAAALMFGTDQTIQQAAPAMVFDALLRKDNVDRYDDRLLLYTNLIDTFDQLMGFVNKHLNDPFYLEGNERISLRDRIFRELVSNLIAHREYTSAAPASMTIFRDKVIFRNPHVPHIRGRLDPAHFIPFPKNPTICRFMLQLGRYEQAGSGVYNVTRYLPHYSHGAQPRFEEQPDLFITTIPLTPEDATIPVTGQVTPPVTRENGTKLALSRQQVEIMRNCIEDKNLMALMAITGRSDRTKFRHQVLNPLIDMDLIEMTIPDKPRSSKQKYRLTAKGRHCLTATKTQT